MNKPPPPGVDTTPTEPPGNYKSLPSDHPNGPFVLIKQDEGPPMWGDLPPITMIVIPGTTTKSALIRWLHKLGYSTSDIYKFLGIKYQMVRNIVTNIPKRAAREDLPAMVVEFKP